MKSLLFVYDHAYPHLWKDGLWAALELLRQDYAITKVNLRTDGSKPIPEADFCLGWGGFGSPVDLFMRRLHGSKGLCIGGNAIPPMKMEDYDVLFYETEWYRPVISTHKHIVHAFGVNTDIYHPMTSPKVMDCLTVGAFALWKRQDYLCNFTGTRMAIGEIQKDNPDESYVIVGTLLHAGVMVSDMLPPEKLAQFYNLAKAVYIPADINGGGERAVLEARACGVPVLVEEDNPKLKELTTSTLYTHHYYASQLKKGIEAC